MDDPKYTDRQKVIAAGEAARFVHIEALKKIYAAVNDPTKILTPDDLKAFLKEVCAEALGITGDFKP